MPDLETQILSLVATATARLAPGDIVKRLRSASGTASRRTIARAISRLVASGVLRYVEESGFSFVEKNYLQAQWLSPHIRMIPRAPRPQDDPNDRRQALWLQPGISFGDGRHPTTRLAVRALDWAITTRTWSSPPISALDIGTGSGVLALAAARLNLKSVLATEIDPCARKEARDNIQINHLAAAIVVTDQPPETIAQQFSVVTANLRLPTLKKYAATINQKTAGGGAVVATGLKIPEVRQLLTAWTPFFRCTWQEAQNDWWAGVFLKKSAQPEE